MYGLADHLFKSLPVVGTLWSRVGGVVAHPDNAYRLLREQRAARARVPRGDARARASTYTERYRLRRFGRGGFVEIAMRAGVPDRPHRRGRRRGVDADHLQVEPAGQGPRPALLSPSPPTRCWPSARSPARGSTSRPSSASGCSTRSTSTSPADQQRYSQEPGHGRGRGHPRAHPVGRSSTCSARAARSGSAEGGPPRPRHRAATFWGGRVAQRLEADPDVDVIVGLDTASPPRSSSSAPSSSGSTRTTRSSARIVAATKVDTIVHTFLVVDSGVVCGRARCTRSTSSAP